MSVGVSGLDLRIVMWWLVTSLPGEPVELVQADVASFFFALFNVLHPSHNDSAVSQSV